MFDDVVLFFARHPLMLWPLALALVYLLLGESLRRAVRHEQTAKMKRSDEGAVTCSL